MAYMAFVALGHGRTHVGMVASSTGTRGECKMFGLGTTELLIILAMVVIGSSRLPGLGRGLGSAMRNFRDAFRDTTTGTDIDKVEPPTK